MPQKFELPFRRLISGKPANIFITNYEGCICYRTYLAARQIKGMTSIHLKGTADKVSRDTVVLTRNYDNLILYLHGDARRTEFFYKSSIEHSIRDIQIPVDWFGNIRKVNRVFYVHACSGSRVIRNTPQLSTYLGQWVSYSVDIMGVFSTENEAIIELNKQFLTGVCEKLQEHQNARLVMQGIYQVYSSLRDSLRTRGENIKGITLITSVLGNCASLECSQ
jgi:hypothetical protein